jgi:hypothetical protein
MKLSDGLRTSPETMFVFFLPAARAIAETVTPCNRLSIPRKLGLSRAPGAQQAGVCRRAARHWSMGAPTWMACQFSQSGSVQLMLLNVPMNWTTPWPSVPASVFLSARRQSVQPP